MTLHYIQIGEFIRSLPPPKKTQRWAALCHRMQTDSFQCRCRFNSYHCLSSATVWAERRKLVYLFSQHTDTLQLLQRQVKPDHQPEQKYFSMRSKYFENTDQLQFEYVNEINKIHTSWHVQFHHFKTPRNQFSLIWPTMNRCGSVQDLEQPRHTGFSVNSNTHSTDED